jgi:hypothetical protein
MRHVAPPVIKVGLRPGTTLKFEPSVSETPRPAAGPAPALAHRRGLRGAATILSAILLLSLIPLVYGALTAVAQTNLGDLFFYLVFLLLPASLGLVGSVLAARRPENRIGWLLLVAGVLTGIAFACGEYERFGIAAARSDWPFFVPAAWLASWLFIPAIGILVIFLPLLYPSGELPGRRWRVVVAVALVGVTLGATGPAFAPGPLADPRGPLNPYVPPDPLASWIQVASAASNIVAPPIFLLAVASLLARFRRSAGVERQQLKWFLFVAVVASVSFAISILGVGTLSDVAWVLGILAMGFLPLAIGVAILRYRLYEIDRIVNRALVYGAVTAILTGVFAAVTALSQRLFISAAGQSSDAAVVLTTLVVVAVYAPVRKRVEAVIDRYFKYDQREYGPYVDELRRLLDVVEPRRAAARLAREALRHTGATGVAVADHSGAVVASAGAWPAESSVRVPIASDRSPLAAVILGPRRDGKPHPPRRLRALAEAGTMAAAAVSVGAVGLGDALPTPERATWAAPSGGDVAEGDVLDASGVAAEGT